MYAIAVIWIMDMEWMNPKDLVRFPDPLHVSRGTRLPRTERRRRKPDQGCKHNLHMLVEPLDAPIKETLVSLMEFFLIFVCICGFGWQNWQNSWVITIFNFLVYLMVHGNPLSLLALKNNQSHVWAEAANPDVMWCHIASKSGVLTKPGDVPQMVETQVGGHQIMVVVVKSQGSHQRLERNLFNWQVTCF